METDVASADAAEYQRYLLVIDNIYLSTTVATTHNKAISVLTDNRIRRKMPNSTKKARAKFLTYSQNNLRTNRRGVRQLLNPKCFPNAPYAFRDESWHDFPPTRHAAFTSKLDLP